MTTSKATPAAFQLPPDLDTLLALASRRQQKSQAAILTRWIKRGAEQDAMALLAAGGGQRGFFAGCPEVVP